MVKEYTTEKLYKTKALTKIYMYTHVIEESMVIIKINKDNIKNKNKNNK